MANVGFVIDIDGQRHTEQFRYLEESMKRPVCSTSDVSKIRANCVKFFCAGRTHKCLSW